MTDRSITVGLLILFLSLMLLIIGVGALSMHIMQELNLSARNIAAQQSTDVRLRGEALDYSTRNSQLNLRIFLSSNRSQIDALIAERSQNSARILAVLTQLQ